jgi:hypothetical protein
VLYQNAADLQGHGNNSSQAPLLVVDQEYRLNNPPVPKANYIHVEAVPSNNGQVRISVQAKSSRYTQLFLKTLLARICENYVL